MFTDHVLTVNTTLTYVDLQQNYPPSNNDIINQRRLEPLLRRNRRLAEVLTGVIGLLHANNNDDDDDNNNNHQQNNEFLEQDNHTIITIANEKIWRLVLNAAMEDVERDKSALFLLMCHAIVGQDACPLHGKVVQALKESALVAVQEEQQQESQAAVVLLAKIA
jgi:hypothetical protein